MTLLGEAHLSVSSLPKPYCEGSSIRSHAPSFQKKQTAVDRDLGLET
ncbi:MAG: hypothetical protein WBD58_10790 [Geitlerinemataceae cyanobacterium]